MGATFEFTMKKLVFKDKKFRDETIIKLESIMRYATGEFIKSALEVVHIDTGMSAGSLVGRVIQKFELGAGPAQPYFHVPQTDIQSRIKHRGWKGNPPYYPTGKAPSEGIRTVAHGRELGEFYCWWTGRQMGVGFRTEVWQYNYWEKEWRTFEAGKTAFEKYFKREVKKLKKLKDYITVVDI